MDFNETVNISISQLGGNDSDLIGATVTITEQPNGNIIYSTTWNGSTISIKIPTSTNYKISVSSINGYITPKSKIFTSGFLNRNVILTYGITTSSYIIDNSYVLYDATTYQTAKDVGMVSDNDVLGILVSSSSYRFILGKENLGSYCTGNGVGASSSRLPALTEANALADYGGKNNSNILIAEYGYTPTTMYAALVCFDYKFANDERGYEPSLGECTMIYNDKTRINALLNVCNEDALPSALSSSSYYGNYGASCSFWAKVMSNGAQGPSWSANPVYPCCSYE